MDITLVIAAKWNVFRYVGDYSRLAGMLLLLASIGCRRSVAGVSLRAQLLYLMVYVTRYLDLVVFDSMNWYLILFKVAYISCTLSTVLGFCCRRATYERQHDTCSILLFIVPCLLASPFVAYDGTVIEAAWTFSQYMDGFAMVPQYVFSYRDDRRGHWGVNAFVIGSGTHHVFYALNWAYKWMVIPGYHDVHSWLGGFIKIMFFADFVAYRFFGRSLLRCSVLGADAAVNQVSNKALTLLCVPLLDAEGAVQVVAAPPGMMQLAGVVGKRTGVQSEDTPDARDGELGALMSVGD